MKRFGQSLRRFSLRHEITMAHRTEVAAPFTTQVSWARCGVAQSSGPLPQRNARKRDPNSPPSTPPDVRSALFDLLRQRLCSPTHPLPVRSVYDELANRSRVVEDFHFSKTRRRLSHQRVALAFLRRYNVLLHSLLFFSENTQTWNTTGEFQRLALFGESILTTEVRGRLLKLFPDIPYPVFVRLLQLVLSEDGLALAFDRYDMRSIVGAKPPDVWQSCTTTTKQKCHMFCAVIGELYWFVARTRPTDRTHNNAIFPPSDVLILHVLSSHLLECIPAELVFHLLEPTIEEIKTVWVNEPMSLPSQLRLVPRTIGAHSLNAVPLPNPAPPTTTAATIDLQNTAAAPSLKQREAQSMRRALTATPDTYFVKSSMRPTCNHRNFDTSHYKVLKTDKLMEKSVLSVTREQQRSDADRTADNEPLRIARAIELARLAIQTS